MTVTEALKVLQRVPKEQEPFRASLACGFTPLHLQLLLNAQLQLRLPTRRVVLDTGIFGNLAVTLEQLAVNDYSVIACACEWADLDPRLGYREGGDWSVASIRDIVAGADQMLRRIREAVDRIPPGTSVAISLPTLPFPPLFHTGAQQSSEAELLLDQSVAAFAAAVVQRKGAFVVNPRHLAEASPLAGRLDLKADLLTGLPYTLPHADALAFVFASLLLPTPPKKGIISDLDDTLWHGLVGEIGPEAVSWDLAHHQQTHGIYQKLLASLADAGILVGIASKNDPQIVAQALRRDDLHLRKDRIFPIEVHWDAKSGSVERILRRWNIGADDVVFIDDSPMELAEVAARHPGITCLQFPQNDPRAALKMFQTLRNLCGKTVLSQEDSLRLDSIRQGAAFNEESRSGSSQEQFLQNAGAELTFDWDAGWEDARALELVNKTNQFNINGVRWTEPDWRAKLQRLGAFVLVVSYKDRFGPLGKIAVLSGRLTARTVTVDTWVMSCRAFARRIEHRCAQALFDRFDADQLDIQFHPTPKNGPSRAFLQDLLGFAPEAAVSLPRADFLEKCPPLYHHVSEPLRAELSH